MKTEKLVIVGAGETAMIAFEHFTCHSAYEVVAFAVEKEFLKHDTLAGLPVIPVEELAARFDPCGHRAFVAISFTQLNRPRTRLYHACKCMGFRMASHVSPTSSVWRNVSIGENCLIMENNTLQYSVTIGNNVTIWSGNCIGHQAVIRDNVSISGHVVIGGYCEVGENCFLGGNCFVGPNVKVAPDCIIGAGAVVLKDTEPNTIYRGNPAMPAKVSSRVFFGVTGENPDKGSS